MGKIRVPIEIRVKNVEFSKDFSINIDTQKHLDKYVARQKVNNECQIAHIEYPPVTFENEIVLSRSVIFPENNLASQESSNWVKINSNSYISSSRNILISKKAIIENRNEKPIFHGMEMPKNTVSATASSYLKDDKDFIFEYDSNSNVIYVNKENLWEPAYRDFRGININYKTSDGESKSILFKNSPLYREISVSDIDPETLEVHRDAPVYSVEEVNGNYKFQINGIGPFFIKEIESGFISIEKESRKINEPWLLQVSSGSLKRRYNGEIYNYVVNEDVEEVFFPYAPYKKYNHKAELIDNRTIKLPKRGLEVNPSLRLNIDIIVRNSEGVLKKAYTTSDIKIGKSFKKEWKVREVTWEALELNYDQKYSIAVLDNIDPLLDTDNVSVSYCAKASYYTINNLNLNPRYNKRIKTHNYLLYIKPSRELIKKGSLFYIEYKENESSRIVTSSNDNDEFNGRNLNDVLEEYFTEGENLHQYMPLAYVGLKGSVDLEEVKVRDIRLKKGLNRKNIKHVLKKHPWAWYTDAFLAEPIEFPDKFFISAKIDKENIKATKDYRRYIEEHSASGSTLIIEEGGLYPRIKAINCKADEELEIILMPERPGVIHRLYLLEPGASRPNEERDTLIKSFNKEYSSSLVKETVDVESLSLDINRFYIVCEDSNTGYRSSPSQIFKVRIRNV